MSADVVILGQTFESAPTLQTFSVVHNFYFGAVRSNFYPCSWSMNTNAFLFTVTLFVLILTNR